MGSRDLWARIAAELALHRHIAHQRDTTSAQPNSDEFINSLQPLTAEAIRREGDALRFAKIGVLSQRERHSFNLIQARAFARHHGRPLFKWKLELTGVAAGWLTDEEVRALDRLV